MRADLLFRRGEYTQAAQHFQELLGRKPGTLFMGGGAGPAGQVLAGPLFASLITHKMRGVSLGLICFLEITAIIFLSVSLSTRRQR